MEMLPVQRSGGTGSGSAKCVQSGNIDPRVYQL